MGSCCIEDLFDFIRKTEGIQVDRQKSFIYTNGVDDKRAIGESNITINCRDGYDLIAGSPLIVCTEQNTWTPFPQCVAIPSVSVPDPSSLRCPIDSDSWNIPNGYLSETRNLLVYSDNTANGKRQNLYLLSFLIYSSIFLLLFRIDSRIMFCWIYC